VCDSWSVERRSAVRRHASNTGERLVVVGVIVVAAVEG